MHKPNPAKFFVSLYFQYLKTFHVYLYLELSKFFLPIAIRKLENRLFPKFSRENQPVLSLGITSPLIWKLIIEIAIQTSQAVFFYEKTISTKALTTSQSLSSTLLPIASIAASALWNTWSWESEETERSQVHTNSGLGKQQDICWILFN